MQVELLSVIANSNGDNTYIQSNILDYKERPGIFNASAETIQKFFDVHNALGFIRKLPIDVTIKINNKTHEIMEVIAIH